MDDRARNSTALFVGSLALDAVLVVVFAIAGRRSHAEGLDVAGLWGTAWPFLAGLGVGWLAARAWRHPLALWPTGVVVWASTLMVGMLLRLASEQGVQVAFVLVAAISLAILLIGWRALTALAKRRSRARASSGL